MSHVFLSVIDALPDGAAAGFDAEVNGEQVPLLALRRGAEVRVFHNVCPHAGRRLEVAPGRFIIDAGTVMCAAHGACFTIPAGDCIAGPCRGDRLRAVAVRCVDGEVRLGAPAAE